MGTAIGVIVCIAVCYGIGWLWEEASKKKGAVGAVARGADAVVDGVGSVVRVVIGVGLILASIFRRAGKGRCRGGVVRLVV